MFACPGGCVIFTVSAAPLSFEVFALVDAENAGLKARFSQPSAWNLLTGSTVPPSDPVRVETACSSAQFVGLRSKPWRSIVTVSDLIRVGTPPTIIGTFLSLRITWPVCGSTATDARARTLPRLNGPTAAGTTIESPVWFVDSADHAWPADRVDPHGIALA